MANANDIAKWFIDNNFQIASASYKGNVKLNKLMYYAKGYYFDLKDEPLFENNIEAWENGPVVKGVYSDYRYNGLCSSTQRNELDSELVLFLKKLNHLYGHKTADELINLTHSEKPWADVEHEVIDRTNPDITDEALRDFFENSSVVLDAIDEDELDNTEFKMINGNVFSYDKRETILNEDDYDKLIELGEIEKNRSLFVYKDENELVVY